MKNLQWHRIVDNNSDQLVNLIHKLLHAFEGKASTSHTSSEHFEDSVRRAIADLDAKSLTPQGHFLEHQTRMTGILRQITRTIQEISAQPNQIDQSRYLTDQLAREYQELSNASQNAIVTATNKELANRIKRSITEIGFANIEFIDQLGQFQEKKSNVDLGKLSQQVNEKVRLTCEVFSQDSIFFFFSLDEDLSACDDSATHRSACSSVLPGCQYGKWYHC